MWTSSNGNIFRVTGPLCGNSPVTGEFPAKGQWRGALKFYLIYAWINGWVNNREAGDLRRRRIHYDVTVMMHHSVDNIRFEKQLHTCLFSCTSYWHNRACWFALHKARWLITSLTLYHTSNTRSCLRHDNENKLDWLALKWAYNWVICRR